MSTRKEQISELGRQLADLKAQEVANQLRAWRTTITGLTKGLTYEEMCGLRQVLNEAIAKKYADEVDE